MQKGSGDNPSKAGPIVVENTYRGLVLGFRRLHFPWSFMGLESIRGPQLSSRPLAFDTIDKFWAQYLAHCGLPDFRLYLTGDCLRAGNLVAYLSETCKGDCGGIPWYLGQTSSHALQSIPGGCFHVRVSLAPVSLSSVGCYNCSSN
jgi:hypothetical protein